jgi:stage II sporulation protein AA (anti-sigma F factor antagonist)
VLVRPVGEIDIASAGTLECRVAELTEAGFAHVVLDLRRVSFMDSTAIRLLLIEHERARVAGSRFSVILGNARVCRPLQIAGVVEHLDVVDR